MIETKIPEINVDDLMREVKAEAALRRGEARTASVVRPIGRPDGRARGAGRGRGSLSLLRMPDTPRFEAKEAYGLADFLSYHDEEFVRYAYWGMLGREPEARGMAYYLGKLRSGELSKTEILGRLRYSPEGRREAKPVAGLLMPFAVGTAGRVPLVGYFVRLGLALIRLPSVLRSMQNFEAFTNQRFAEVRDIFNESARRMEDKASYFEDKVAGLEERVEHLVGVATRLENRATRLEDRAARLEERSTRQEDSLRGLAERTVEDIRKINDGLAQLRMAVAEGDRRMSDLADAARARLAEAPELARSAEVQALLAEGEHVSDTLYLFFEDRFRGSREEIKARQAVYLPSLDPALGPVLDVGCGRGEWLELLKENGFTACGIDLNRIMVRECLERGLDVSEGDVLARLRAMPEASLGAVTGFHIVEHLKFDDLVALLDQALRVLKPGGTAIFETPNPENLITGACNFYVDPSHKNPIPPVTLEYLTTARGFAQVEIKRLHPNESRKLDDPVLQELLFGPQDYAVLGRKA